MVVAEHGHSVDVLLRRDREHERRDRQPESTHAECAKPDRNRHRGDDERGEWYRHQERQRRRMKVDDPDVELEPSRNAAANSAPNPANVIWASDNCPAHPVMTESDMAQIAKQATLA